MNIEHLRLFIRVAALGNISKAGSELGITAPVASNHLLKLEESLGARLIHRTTRKASLTAEGEVFLSHAKQIVEQVEIAKASVGVNSDQPQGVLRITTPASFGRLHVVPHLKAFCDLYPDLTVDLHLSDTQVDLVAGGYDVAIRNATLPSSNLVARKLTSDKRILCASKLYLDASGMPKTANDLLHHKCINQTGLEGWSLEHKGELVNIKKRGPIRLNDGEAVRRAAISGMGIAMCATWLVYEQLKSGQLVRVLENYKLLDRAAIWAVYPSNQQVAPKVRAFIDYFVELYGDSPYWEE